MANTKDLKDKPDHEIFFSYAWRDNEEPSEDREKMVGELYNSLEEEGFNVLIDKKNSEYTTYISEFMSAIGQGKLIVVAISQKYLKSPYCMWELYEIARNSK